MVAVASVRSVVGDGLEDEELLLCGKRLFHRLRDSRIAVTVLAPGALFAIIQRHIGEQAREKALLDRDKASLIAQNTLRDDSVDKTVPLKQC